jgi:hypothetical protein
MYSRRIPQDDAINTTRPAKIGAFIVDLSPQEEQGEERKADGINVAAEPIIKAKGIIKNELFIITTDIDDLPSLLIYPLPLVLFPSHDFRPRRRFLTLTS